MFRPPKSHSPFDASHHVSGFKAACYTQDFAKHFGLLDSCVFVQASHLCYLETVFHEGLHLPPHQPFRLSAMAINELLALVLLGPLIQTDMRASVAPRVFMMDASPTGGAVCQAWVGDNAVSEMWRHSEQRGFYTALQQGAGNVLRELFGPETNSCIAGGPAL